MHIDLRRKIKSRGKNDMIDLSVDLLLENCKYRKLSNEFVQAVQQGNKDQLELLKYQLCGHIQEPCNTTNDHNNNNNTQQTIGTDFMLDNEIPGILTASMILR
jgi:hypothetical protein